MSAKQLSQHPVHLGLGACAEIEPEFTGEMEWYGGYVARHAKDGAEGRLVSMSTFTDSWDVWEMHPMGAEVVVCTGGSLRLLQEQADGSVSSCVLNPGDYIVNAPGVWHTADIEHEATALFITAGLGTEHRPRE